MKSKSLDQWLADISAGHPTEIDMGLTRVTDVLHRLSLDLSNSKVITVAGTNGKGTTCRTISSLLVESGYSVGTYASPHLFSFNERIQLQTQAVSDETICDAFQAVKQAQDSGEHISLTYFEYATLAALVCFARANVDFIVLEVGLGGRLDATNILDADVGVITSIGFDHQDWLGNTLAEISAEKVGILKPNTDAVIGCDPKEHDLLLPSSFSSESSANSEAQMPTSRIVNRDFGLSSVKQKQTDETSTSFSVNPSKLSQGVVNTQDGRKVYQWQHDSLPPQNVITAITALWSLSYRYSTLEPLNELLNDPDRVTQCIDKISIPGRAQIVHYSPTVLVDVAHNAQAASYLRDKVKELISADTSSNDARKIHFVCGMLIDKNVKETLAELVPLNASWYLCSLNEEQGGSRAQSSEQLLAHFSEVNSEAGLEKHEIAFSNVYKFDSVSDGVKSALEQAVETDIICVFGSFVTAAEALTLLDGN